MSQPYRHSCFTLILPSPLLFCHFPSGPYYSMCFQATSCTRVSPLPPSYAFPFSSVCKINNNRNSFTWCVSLLNLLALWQYCFLHFLWMFQQGRGLITELTLELQHFHSSIWKCILSYKELIYSWTVWCAPGGGAVDWLSWSRTLGVGVGIEKGINMYDQGDETSLQPFRSL